MRAIVLAGVGALYRHAEGSVKEPVESLRIPSIATYRAKGIIDERHPLVIGG